MISIFLRTLFVYLVLMLFMRLLGKRQVGQMQVEELVTALLLSELAAFPIADPDTPLIYAAVPVLIIVFCELLFACLCAIFPRFKKLVEGAPTILISHGKLDEKQLCRCRISPDELLAQLRLKDVPDIALVEYAILEQSGQLSVVLKKDGGKEISALSLPMIVNGTLHRTNLKRFGITPGHLKARLGGVKICDVLLYTVTEDGKDVLIKRGDYEKTDR